MFKKVLSLLICIMFMEVAQAYTYEEYVSKRSNTNQVLQDQFSDYMNYIKAKLEKNWIAPDIIQNGHARVVFILDREGYVRNVKMVESSGNAIYDESAIHALQKSEPFVGFPESSTRENITVNYSFDVSPTEVNSKVSDTKRLHFVKHLAEVENSPFAYFYLAYCYEKVGDYDNAIESIDKSISLTELNNQYKRYRAELVQRKTSASK